MSHVEPCWAVFDRLLRGQEWPPPSHLTPASPGLTSTVATDTRLHSLPPLQTPITSHGYEMGSSLHYYSFYYTLYSFCVENTTNEFLARSSGGETGAESLEHEDVLGDGGGEILV